MPPTPSSTVDRPEADRTTMPNTADVVTTLDRLTERVGTLVAELDPERLTPSAALALLGTWTRLANAAGAGRALVARRVDECDAHARTGHRSTAHLIAETGGTSIARATELLETGRHLRTHAATDAALRSGTVSVEQAHVVTTATDTDPTAEAELLAFAGRESLRRLTERARDIRLAADDDRLGRHRRQHAARSLRHGREDDGMIWGHFRLPPETGAAVVNGLERRADHEFRAARTEGRREAHDRFLADALVAIVTGDAGEAGGTSRAAPARGRGAEVVVHVSREALLRGRVEAGERCLVQGAGPVPVETAREIMADAFLKGVLVDGTDVVTVRHFGRRRPAELRTALETRAVLRDGDVTCTAPGCDQRLGLEWDHREPHARGGPTSYDNLQPLCRHHHRHKTLAEGRAPP